MYIILWDYESVWPEVWSQNKYRSLWPIFYGPVIWPYLMNIICCMKKSLFGIMNQYDSTFDLKVDVGYCDLYFMVQWFYITSWRQFDVWTLYFGIMGQYDMIFDLKINVGLCYLYFMAQWFCLISPTLFDAPVSYFQTMRQCDQHFDLKVNMSWPIFHGLVILLNTFLIIWWINIKVGIMDQCDTSDWPYQVYVGQWSIFYGPVILFQTWRLFSGEILCLGYWISVTQIDLVNYMWVSDLYFMVYWFCLMSLS